MNQERLTIIFFAHPEFIPHQSMPRYAGMLSEGMKQKGYKTEIWHPQPLFFKLAPNKFFKKWFGYFDQFIVFPLQVKNRIKACNDDTLFVFTDHALGPWVSLVKHKPHVIHCHDFLAQQSAIDQIPENIVGWTGKKYQLFIKKGFIQGKHFISVSKKTKADLHKFLITAPLTSEVIYNGLNQQYPALDPVIAKTKLSALSGINLSAGYILHVGGNQFYKNRQGVIEIYNEWRKNTGSNMILLLIGEAPDEKLLITHKNAHFKSDIHFLPGRNDEFVKIAYAGATVLLFPSIAEGFGWPIAEAMAAGCPVITTNEAPMNEVAGEAASFISKRPANDTDAKTWATSASKILESVVNMTVNDRSFIIQKGITNSKRFDPQEMLNQTEVLYNKIILLYT